MKKFQVFLSFLAMVAILSFATRSQADHILLTQFDEPQGYAEMVTDLTSVGHTVDIVDATVGGNVASALTSEAYDQVFLWDLAWESYLTAPDITALASFWNTDMGLVVDTRSYGYHFQPDNTSEIALIQNVAANLSLSGGGVWVGTDHNPGWTHNSNPFLNAIGVTPISGSYSDPVNYADGSSVLLAGVNPTDLWGGGQSIGMAPIGIQPNGIEMYIHFGHIFNDGTILPYISASFPLEGPNPTVPEPATFLLFGLGILGITGVSRKTQK